MMRFSERYRTLVFDPDGGYNDRITGFDEDTVFHNKKKIVELMLRFDEPLKLRKSRYNKETIESGAFRYALQCFDHDYGSSYFLGFGFADFGAEDYTNAIRMLEGGFTPFLFDIIEYQYEVLSEKEKRVFGRELNELMRDLELPWALSDGKWLKIDSMQFEMDLKRKTAEALLELAKLEPQFKPAYEELVKSIDFYNKGDYAEAIMNANKSYESVMKVFLGVDNAKPGSLLEGTSKRVELPDAIKADGFKDNVLLCLPYIRNNACGHGEGSRHVIVSKELANLSINLACSLCTFVVAEYKKLGGSTDA